MAKVPPRVLDGHFTDTKTAGFTPEDFFRFTTRGQYTLYAICLANPGREVVIRSLSSNMKLYPHQISEVRLCGIRRAARMVAKRRTACTSNSPATLPGEFGVSLKITR